MTEELTPMHRKWRVNIFLATWMSYAGFYFCRKAFGVVKKPLRDLLEVSDFEISHIWTAYLIAYMIGQFMAGWLGSKVACRRLLLVGMMISLCCNLVFGFSTLAGPHGYWPLFFFMIINGFAQATGWPGNIGTIAHWFRRKERGTMMGWWGTCYQLGSMAAKAFAGFMFGWLGLAWSFYGSSLILFAIWIAFYFLHRNTPEDVGLSPIVTEATEQDSTDVVTPEDSDDSSWSRSVIQTLVLMGCAYFSFKFLRYCIDSWSNMVIEENFKTSTANAAYISVIFDWVGFAGVIISGWISDKFFGGKRAAIALYMSIGMFFTVVLLWLVGMSSLAMFATLLGLLGFFLFGPDALLSGVGTIDVGSKKKAVLAAGIVNGIGSAGAVLQEPLIGYIKGAYGMNEIFLLLIGIAFLGVMGTGVLWNMSRSGKSAL